MSETQFSPSTAALDFIQRQHKFLIGDQWLDAEDGRTLPVINPANGEQMATVPSGSKADIDKAVATARQTFEDSEWSRIKPVDRQKLLWNFADLIEKNAGLLAEIETLDNGKNVAVAEHVDIR
ncbi:MAG: aldehyde dehydrogenase family protein, partial [Amphritea sp.]|nr:aldehyde dehydrogenase family protein [Amphritea sp.]